MWTAGLRLVVLLPVLRTYPRQVVETHPPIHRTISARPLLGRTMTGHHTSAKRAAPGLNGNER